MIRVGNENKYTLGFTIVELLIVIVVIAILAAITIVAYTGIRERAISSSIQSSALQAGKQIAAFGATNADIYPDTLSEIGLQDTGNEEYTYIVNNSISPARYCVSVESVQSSGVSYAFSSTSSGIVEGTCVRNYALNPNAAPGTTYLKGIGSNQASSTLIATSDRPFTGTISFKREITGSGQAFGGMTAEGSVLTSDRIHWSYEVYSTRAGTMNNWSVGQRASNGNNLGTGGSTGNQLVPANEWKHMASSMSPSEEITMDRYGGYNLPVEPGDTVWMDSFMVTITEDEYEFADGSSPGWAWDGQPNASTSFGPAKLYSS